MSNNQRTVQNKISCFGIGLHTGVRVDLALLPADEDTGIIFKRVDIKDKNQIVAASYDNVSNTVLGTATVIVTPTALGCTGIADTFLMSVKPQPTVSVIPATQSVCNGATTATIDFSGTVAFTTFQWTQSNITIGNINPAGADDISPFTVVNHDSVVIADTFIVTPHASGCIGVPETVIVNAKPIPAMRSVSDRSFCNGVLTTPIGFASNVAGTTYSWTNGTTSIGLGASGIGAILPFTATNTTTAPVAAAISVTPDAAGCVGTAANFDLTVLPTPTADTIGDITVCNNAAVAAIGFSGPVSGTTFNWTNDNPAIGLAPSGIDNIATFTAINTDTADVTATITVTPTADGCPGPARTFTITVHPTPVATRPAAINVCNADPVPAINFMSSVTGSSFTWTNSNTAIGLGASGSGDIATFAGTNNSIAPAIANIVVTPTSPFGCAGDTVQFTITVNPTPRVNALTPAEACNGATTPVIPITGLVATAIYSWTNSDTTIGLAATGTGAIPSFVAVDTASVPAVATITITPSAFGCVGPDSTMTYTVLPSPSVYPVSDIIVCNNDTTSAISFSGRFSGATFVWTNDNTDIGLAASDSGTIARFVATNASSINDTANITVTPHVSACYGAPTSFRIIVKPTPGLATSLTSSVCDSNAFTYVPAGTLPGSSFTWLRDSVAGIENSSAAGSDSVVETRRPITFILSLPMVVLPQRMLSLQLIRLRY
ncbi:MAG: hypothetical protein EBZ77_04990 [Chitinophagia bacterium]|nr:hypothetical protein [Chitinophagia bacterium]